MGQHIVLRHDLADGVHDAEIVLRLGLALLGGHLVPLRRFAKILRHALAFGVHQAEVELGGGELRRGLQRRL